MNRHGFWSGNYSIMEVFSNYMNKIFICYPISKLSAAHFTTNQVLNIGKKIFCFFTDFKIIKETL